MTVPATGGGTIGRHEPVPEPDPAKPRVEGPPRRGWRTLYGGFHELGVSIEWHDFELPHRFDWSRSFHRGALELCLNLSGRGLVGNARAGAEFMPLTAGFYASGDGALHAWRQGRERHRFIAVEFSSGFLRGHLSQCDGALHPLAEQVTADGPGAAGFGEVHRLTADQEQRAVQLLHPPAAQAARRLWYQSQVLQLMVEFFFERQGEDELFCDRQRRLARERVDKVIAILREHLAQPPGLEEIGRKAGCSPFHLSRTFSREMGMTIRQYLRKLRMERAAELLRGGRHNVTEAALEVGYSSLSHFSQAFCQTMGCCPALYPLKRPS